jgi:hypothetical protein
MFLALLSAADPEEEAAKKEAGKHLARGNALFDAKKYEQALDAFRDAYDAYPSAKIHYNLARTRAALGQTIEALDHFDRFIDDSGLAKEDKRIKTAEAERAELEKKVGRLVFVTEIDGASLTLDGQGPAPLPRTPVRVTPGSHRAKVETSDGRMFEETVTAGAGATVRVRVLFSMPTPPPPPPPKVEVVEAPPPVIEESTPITSEWWFWTAIGAGVVVIAAGVAAGVAAQPDGFEAEGELDVTSTAQWEKL